MFQPTRDAAREFLFEAWRKHKAREILTPLEDLATRILLEHPEYHRVLDDPERYRDRDYTPEAGETNPFLHLSLHLAVEEQLSIDQPPGIRGRFEALGARGLTRHEALHEVLDCLAETIWQAQRSGAGVDAAGYMECLDRKAR